MRESEIRPVADVLAGEIPALHQSGWGTGMRKPAVRTRRSMSVSSMRFERGLGSKEGAWPGTNSIAANCSTMGL